jgi:hypothetical protein
MFTRLAAGKAGPGDDLIQINASPFDPRDKLSC